MKVKNTPIDELRPYAHNPKTHPETQIDKIARSIEEFGFLVPILIDADNYIIAGHGRLLAARKLGLVEVPTIRVDHLTEAQIRAYRIADNKLTESPWDIGELMVEIDDLKLGDYDIDLTGFGEIELGEVITKKGSHDVTCEYQRGEEIVLEQCLRFGVKRAYLLKDSPMCDRDYGVLGRLLEANNIWVTRV